MVGLAQAIVGLVFGLIQILLVARFFFRFINASANAGIVDWVYRNSYPFVEPFLGILQPMNIGPFLIDWNTLIAIIFFAIIGGVIQTVLRNVQN